MAEMHNDLAEFSTLSLPTILENAMAQQRAGNLAQAEALYRQILDLQPQHPDALHLLGLAAHQQGRRDEAIALIDKAIAIAPTAAMYANLGHVFHSCGELEAAATLFRHACELDPANAEFHNNLGSALHDQGKLSEAINTFLQAIALQPDHAGAYCNMGVAAYDLGHLDEAIRCYQTALSLDPDSAIAHNNLGNALRAIGNYDDAAPHFERAIALAPDYALAWSNLGNLVREQGQAEQAAELYRQSLALNPQQPGVHSNLLFTLLSLADASPDDIFAEHRRFADRFEAPLRPDWRQHDNRRDANKRLKLGYVSGDFRDHAVAYFFEPILAGHDRTQIEVFCYYNNFEQDAVTQRIAAACDHWLPCKSLSDEALAQRIREDGIDILIDLSGHTANNRLLMFARKPAPVQMTWMGSPSTTGLAAVDYRLTDAAVDPPGLTERYHSETPLHLPYTAPFRLPAAQPPVNDLPALTHEVFTFASLNNLSKISGAAIVLWARILNALPHARLILGNANESARHRLLDTFAAHGVNAERLEILPRLSLDNYLALHHRIDLALDPFPYNGGITTLHSLSMGVPVIALTGETPASRWGAGIMTNAGFPEFVAGNPDEYVQLAMTFAKDLPRLQGIRQTLRDTCPLFCHIGDSSFTRHLERVLREAWTTWCNADADHRKHP
jgi:predicted O-linked N-acetylglucosamine transferase (SPINDLY family)